MSLMLPPESYIKSSRPEDFYIKTDKIWKICSSFIKKETPAQVCFCKYNEVFQDKL